MTKKVATPAKILYALWILWEKPPFVFPDFPWPHVPSRQTAPIWTGRSFEVGEDEMRVLNYDVNPSNWSDELTELHEREAGSRHPMDLASRGLAVETMHGLTPSRPVIMDIGCSSGYLVAELKEALPGAFLIGADFIRGSLDRLADRLQDVPLVQFDLRRCPFPDESIDGVTCLNVLEHIDEDKRSLEHIWRILRPGGLAHIEVPAGPGLFDVYDEFLLHYRRYTMRRLEGLARETGFVVERATHLGFLIYPAFWICKKRGQRGELATNEEKARLVAGFIKSSRTSRLFAFVIRMEIALGRLMNFPCGVRCVVVLRKPGNPLVSQPGD